MKGKSFKLVFLIIKDFLDSRLHGDDGIGIPQMEKKLILILNCGSSSIKFAVIDPKTDYTAISGLIQKIGAKDASIKYTQDKTTIACKLGRPGDAARRSGRRPLLPRAQADRAHLGAGPGGVGERHRGVEPSPGDEMTPR